MLSDLYHQIISKPGFSPGVMVVGMVMYGAWTAAYLCIIISCFRERSYGVPMVCLCFNVIWEGCFTSMILDQKLDPFFRYGNGLWFLFDIVIAIQFFLYGREAQIIPLLKRYFYFVAVFTLILCGAGLATFTFYFGDYTGSASSMMMNFVMSILYIFLLFARPDLRGLSYPAAWLKMIGTAAGSVFLFFWFPEQFPGEFLRTHPFVPKPRTFSFLYFLYISIFAIDCIYIYLLAMRRRELKEMNSAREVANVKPAMV